jgi:hypothetical protein
MVFGIWEPAEDYEAFASHLLPSLRGEGISADRPPASLQVTALSQ